jgi:hypothetical protein
MLPIYPDFYSRRVKAARVVTKEAIPDLGDDLGTTMNDGHDGMCGTSSGLST